MANADKPEDFITTLVKLQEDCGVADLKMSDFGFTPDEAMTLAKGARSMQGGLFEANPCEMTTRTAPEFLKNLTVNIKQTKSVLFSKKEEPVYEHLSIERKPTPAR